MIYITINPGSSSLKYAVFSYTGDNTSVMSERSGSPTIQEVSGVSQISGISGVSRILSGKVARINEGSVLHKVNSLVLDDKEEEIESRGLQSWLEVMKVDVESVISTSVQNDFHQSYQHNQKEMILIIRVVYDGGAFQGPVEAHKDTITLLEGMVERAPLHLPLAIETIKACKLLFDADIWLVFDTHFHRSLPVEAQFTGFSQGLIRQFTDEKGESKSTDANSNHDSNDSIRRFGFHGLSYKYITDQVSSRDGFDHRIIACHLGSGSSICAIDNGKSIQTSMGFGPGTGLLMGSRSGDVDWEVLLYLMQIKNLNPVEARSLLYKHSGILGMTGATDLMPEVIKHLDEERYQRTFDQYIYRIVMTIGSYIPLFDGLPTHLVFTGGIGAGSDLIRSAVCSRFEHLSWLIDNEKNSESNDTLDYVELELIDSAIRIVATPTDEELVMVEEVVKELGA